MELRQEQKQRTIPTQELQRSLTVLQLPLQELGTFVTELLLDNPLAEIELPELSADDGVMLPASDGAREDAGDGLRAFDPPELSARQETLTDSLLDQLGQSASVPSSLLPLCRFLVFSLNSRGWLDDTVSGLAAAAGVPEETLLQALYLVQALSPAGVGARSLEECLLLQLARTDSLDANTLAVVTRCLPLLAKGGAKAVGAALRLRPEEAERCCAAVRRLEPFPGRGFGNAEPDGYIIPDAVVEESGGTFYVRYRSRCLPVIRRNSEYDALLRGSGAELRAYLDGKGRQLEAVRTDLARREETVTRVLRFAVSRQSNYLRGLQPAPAPLQLSEAAESLGLAVSTVSRAVRNKYVTLPAGTVPLKTLFTQAAAGDVSKPLILARLRGLIEDESCPLSDEGLRAALEICGIRVSRRTVAAYREELGYPPAARRRKEQAR